MRIAIGCDHRGIDFKEEVIKIAAAAGHDCRDLGTNTTEAVDYPDIAKEVGEVVAGGEFDRGILICGTGIGMSIAANKLPGIRAALCHNAFSAGRARQHNDANILCLGAEYGLDGLEKTVTAFLVTEFEGGRHQRRVDKMKVMEG